MSTSGAKENPVYKEITETDAEYLKNLEAMRDGIADLIKLYNPPGDLAKKPGKKQLEEIQIMVLQLIEAQTDIRDSLVAFNDFAPEEWAAKIAKHQKLYADFIFKTKDVSFGDQDTTDLINMKFVEFIKRDKQDRQPLNLASYLTTPMQRMGKYPLLIREFMKTLPEEDNRLISLRKAAPKIEAVVEGLNEAGRSADKAKLKQQFEADLSAYSSRRLPSTKKFSALVKSMLHNVEEGSLDLEDIRKMFHTYPLTKMSSSEIKIFLKASQVYEERYTQKLASDNENLNKNQKAISTATQTDVLKRQIEFNKQNIKKSEDKLLTLNALKDVVTQKVKLNKIDELIKKAKGANKSNNFKIELLNTFRDMIHKQYQKGELLKVGNAFQDAYAVFEKSRDAKFQAEIPHLASLFKSLDKLFPDMEISVESMQDLVAQKKRIDSVANNEQSTHRAPLVRLSTTGQRVSDATQKPSKSVPLLPELPAVSSRVPFEKMRAKVIQNFENLISPGLTGTQKHQHAQVHLVAVKNQVAKIKGELLQKNSPREIAEYLTTIINDKSLNSIIHKRAREEMERVAPQQVLKDKKRPGHDKG
ncbi:MAG: hypothetical protein HYX61_06005 [Gammaproteobacteria bacterium]|jgi:hypothetical protein|nr:hypothetical protein [Gammaproteobacteria bacterium]